MKQYLDKKYQSMELRLSILKKELLLDDAEFDTLKKKYGMFKLSYPVSVIAGVLELELG